MLDNIFSCNEDNENVNESLNKEEVGAKTLTKNKYNKSHLVCHKLVFRVIVITKNLIAFPLNQNIHI